MSIESITDAVARAFEAQKRVLSFNEYLEECAAHPQRHLRDAPSYLKDCFDHFGAYEVNTPLGAQRRFRIFDGDGNAPATADAELTLVGHEAVQQAVYQSVESFVKLGRANRLVLLHGPNGSAKSTLVSCMMRGLERYSALADGALYTFSWVFPVGHEDKHIGFAALHSTSAQLSTYAHLPDTQLAVKLKSPLREHPLLLMPTRERQAWIKEAYQGREIRIPRMLWEGNLGHNNQQILEALLVGYQGDFQRVLAHVQVERFTLSRRFRRGMVSLGPQLSVDARERQITADLSLHALPASLSALALFNVEGPLPDASRGVIEFSDLLKRPIDAWRYLLTAVETSEVALTTSNLPLDSVMLGTSNDLHLEAFKQHHEYLSFRGRLRLVRMPYLLNVHDEEAVYATQVAPKLACHIAPHALHMAATWAVLTRLKRPLSERYPSAKLGQMVSSLSPMEKAKFFASDELPRRFDAQAAAELRAAKLLVADECAADADYEGGSGMSPRDMLLVLIDAADRPGFEGLSPLAILRSLEDFCRRSDHAFLKLEPENGYYDATGFIAEVRQLWLDLVEADVRHALKLVEEGSELERMHRYLQHVSQSLKREKVRNPVTGVFEDPDQDFMAHIEHQLDIKRGESFRQDLMSQVAGCAMGTEDAAASIDSVLQPFADRLEQAFFEEHRATLGRAVHSLILRLSPQDSEVDSASLPGDSIPPGGVDRALETMLASGYSHSSLRDALTELERARFAD